VLRERTEHVAVDGGSLAVHVLGDAEPAMSTVVALHSISSNGLAWVPLARTLPARVGLLAPDLRGRAESSGLRSTGLADHVADVVRVLDHFGLERPVLAGHSMGAFVAALAAATHPDRVSGVVLVDGGLAFPSPGTLFNAIADVDEVLHSIIGPAMDRLSMTFEDQAAYLRHWADHPAMGPLLESAGGGDLAAYLLHDLAGQPGAMRSTSSLECVRADWADLMSDPATLSAVHTLQCPARLFWAARGPLGQAEGLYSSARIEEARLPGDVQVTGLDADHYSVLLDAGPVGTIAWAVGELAGVPTSGRGIHPAVK
jgi:pimeloyl-ACP methyl ester carboxylesterase